MNKEIAKLLYEKPNFNKYGTMKNLTFGGGGSPADGVGSSSDGVDSSMTADISDPDAVTSDPNTDIEVYDNPQITGDENFVTWDNTVNFDDDATTSDLPDGGDVTTMAD